MEVPVGVRVFPSSHSQQIRKSTDFIHYSPVADPPIDYTIREKQKTRPDYAFISDPFKKDISPDFEHEEDFVKNPPRLSDTRKRREKREKREKRPTQIIDNLLTDAKSRSPPPVSRLIRRRDTLRETEMVLDDLESTLEFEENVSFQEARRRLLSSNIDLRPFAPSKEPLPDYDETKTTRSHSSGSSLDRARCLAVQGQAASMAPILNEIIIEDLKSIHNVEDVTNVNEHRKKMVEDMYEKTRALIAEAHLTYTIEFFLRKYDDTDIPKWKRDLMAKKASKETLRKYEENAWEEFNQWKRQYAPNVRLSPEYQFAIRPALY